MAIQKLSPFRLWTLQNFPFIAEDFDALTTYELLCKIVEYLNNVIEITNNQTSAIQNLQNLYNELKEYVDNYFENLDIQTEIDNKLDEMAESGELEEIIGEYINTNAILTYNTLSDLKSAQNLINGSKVRILGYHTIADGGASNYYVREVTNQDIENDMDIIALYNTDLVAEFIPDNDELNIKQFGAYGDDTNDDTSVLTFAISYANTKNLKLFIPSGTYLITESIEINNDIIGGLGNLHFNGASQSFYSPTNSSFNIKNTNIVNDTGHGIQINHEGNINSSIENCSINAHGYGVLVNSNSDNGKNLSIKNNNIYAGSDAIEINTPHTTNTKFENVFIENNILEVDTERTGSSSGFTIAVANGQNILINNNIINTSRNEAIHLEDGSDDIIVTNNILNNCVSDGIRILTNTTKSDRTPLISNNIIKSTNNEGIGIYAVSDSNGSIKGASITNNKISGFNNGITIGGSFNTLNLDGTIIDNCNIALRPSSNTNITGNVIIRNCTTGLYTSADRTNINIDNLSFDTYINPNSFIQVTKSSSIVNIKRLTIRNQYTCQATANYHNVVLCKLPKYINGTISFKSNTTGGESTRINSINWDGTTLTTSTIASHNNGTTSTSLIESDGNLVLRVYAPNIAVDSNINVQSTIDGMFTIDGEYNY